jgi:hypothetical protein
MRERESYEVFAKEMLQAAGKDGRKAGRQVLPCLRNTGFLNATRAINVRAKIDAKLQQIAIPTTP